MNLKEVHETRKTTSMLRGKGRQFSVHAGVHTSGNEAVVDTAGEAAIGSTMAKLRE